MGPPPIVVPALGGIRTVTQHALAGLLQCVCANKHVCVCVCVCQVNTGKVLHWPAVPPFKPIFAFLWAHMTTRW